MMMSVVNVVEIEKRYSFESNVAWVYRPRKKVNS